MAFCNLSVAAIFVFRENAACGADCQVRNDSEVCGLVTHSSVALLNLTCPFIPLETNHRVHHWSGLPLGCPLCLPQSRMWNMLSNIVQHWAQFLMPGLTCPWLTYWVFRQTVHPAFHNWKGLEPVSWNGGPCTTGTNVFVLLHRVAH